MGPGNKARCSVTQVYDIGPGNEARCSNNTGVPHMGLVTRLGVAITQVFPIWGLGTRLGSYMMHTLNQWTSPTTIHVSSSLYKISVNKDVPEVFAVVICSYILTAEMTFQDMRILSTMMITTKGAAVGAATITVSLKRNDCHQLQRMKGQGGWRVEH